MLKTTKSTNLLVFVKNNGKDMIVEFGSNKESVRKSEKSKS